MQRYENKSKSQRYVDAYADGMSCLRLCKDTKIKANHNRYIDISTITLLSKTLQRYENKSKSQPKTPQEFVTDSCLRLCKDTKIKANHNKFEIIQILFLVV